MNFAFEIRYFAVGIHYSAAVSQSFVIVAAVVVVVVVVVVVAAAAVVVDIHHPSLSPSLQN